MARELHLAQLKRQRRPLRLATLAAGLGLVAVACSNLEPAPPSTAPTPSTEPSAPVATAASEKAGPQVVAATVTRIVDGDTARMDIPGGANERVRFIGMDTPESGRPYFEEASAYAARSLLDNEVFLEYDVETRDRFGRVLAYVWTVRPSTGTREEIRERMFNARALLDGYAALLTVPPNVRYVDFFVEFQREARESGRGLWGETPSTQGNECDPSYPDVCIPPPPPDLDCGEITHRNFRVVPPDPHRFDGNRDGYGCES